MIEKCPNCKKSIEAEWKVCPFCEFNLSSNQVKINDSVIQRSEIEQSTRGHGGNQSISDSVTVRSTITQESLTKVDRILGTADDTSKLFQDLQQLSSQQAIKDSVIHKSTINQIQKITATFVKRGFEYLICSNPKCTEALYLTENQTTISNLNSIKITCDKCGHITPYEEALSNAQKMLTSHRNIISRIERGDFKDAKIRSYVYQRDVIDYLADKFLTISQFMEKPMVSTPYIPIEAIGREIEYGLAHEEYIEIIMTVSKLPKNPYIMELAGNKQDEDEGERQSIKLRAVAKLLWGLISLEKVCSAVKNNEISYPLSSQKLEDAENYIITASSICYKARDKYPEESFFKDFGIFSESLANYVEGIRLYSHCYFLPELFEESRNNLLSLTDTESFKLDKTQLSAVFSDPGKDRIRKKAEIQFRDGAFENSEIIEKWRSELKSIPGFIEDTAENYKDIINDFISNKKSITKARVGQLCIGIPFIIYLLLALAGIIPLFVFETGICITNLIVIVGLPGIIFFIGSSYINPRQQKCINLANQFENIRNTVSNHARYDISVRSFHSQKVVDLLTEPLNNLEELWVNKIKSLSWISKSQAEQLIKEVNNVLSAPIPMRNNPPTTLIKI